MRTACLSASYSPDQVDLQRWDDIEEALVGRRTTRRDYGSYLPPLVIDKSAIIVDQEHTIGMVYLRDFMKHGGSHSCLHHFNESFKTFGEDAPPIPPGTAADGKPGNKTDDRSYRLQPGVTRKTRGHHHLALWISQGASVRALIALCLMPQHPRRARGPLPNWHFKRHYAAALAFTKATAVVQLRIRSVYQRLFPRAYAAADALVNALRRVSLEADKHRRYALSVWLGKALLFNATSAPHRDNSDSAKQLTALFLGADDKITGGWLCLPELHARFEMRPGTLIIFRGRQLEHYVSDWSGPYRYMMVLFSHDDAIDYAVQLIRSKSQHEDDQVIDFDFVPDTLRDSKRPAAPRQLKTAFADLDNEREEWVRLGQAVQEEQESDEEHGGGYDSEPDIEGELEDLEIGVYVD